MTAVADSFDTRPFKTRPSVVAIVKPTNFVSNGPVGVEDGDQERLGRLVGEGREIGPDLDTFVSQAMA